MSLDSIVRRVKDAGVVAIFRKLSPELILL